MIFLLLLLSGLKYNKYRQQFIFVCVAPLKMRYISAHNLSFLLLCTCFTTTSHNVLADVSHPSSQNE